MSSFVEFLYDMQGKMGDTFTTDSPLFRTLEAEVKAKMAADKAYMDALSVTDRERYLLLQRIERVERRYRNWWETNMAWRFRADPPDYGDDW